MDTVTSPNFRAVWADQPEDVKTHWRFAARAAMDAMRVPAATPPSDRQKRLDETVLLIGKALEAGRALASIFPLDDDAMPKAKEIVAQRTALLNTACYEFKTTFIHDLAAVSRLHRQEPSDV